MCRHSCLRCDRMYTLSHSPRFSDECYCCVDVIAVNDTIHISVRAGIACFKDDVIQNSNEPVLHVSVVADSIL